jgi:RNA polymerase sigma-70 factor (ECF subfamily)
MNRFNGQCSLKTWLYRIAIHEASNQRRWWFRHKSKETSMESRQDDDGYSTGLGQTLADPGDSPLETFAHEEIRARVEQELQQVAEPYRTTVVLRDIEGLSYEEIAEVLQISLGTVKSRLIRGRDALRKRLEPFVRQMSCEVRDGSRASSGMVEQQIPGQRLPDALGARSSRKRGREVEAQS